MTELSITFLGTSASMPTAKRGLTSTLITRDGEHFLFDCGEGTQRQMMKGPGLKHASAIFITHYHPDHWLGLPGYLATLKLMEHDEPVFVFGPKDGIDTIKMICQRSGGHPDFVQFIGVEPGVHALASDGFEINVFKTLHTGNSVGYKLKEYDRPGRFDVDLALELGVKAGPCFGRLQNGESVEVSPFLTVTPDRVMGPPRRGRQIVVTGDTAPCESVVSAAFGADVLVHEATFSEDMWQRARKTKHSTGKQAAEIAAKAEVGRLFLTHFSARSDVSTIVAEAAGEYSPVQAAKDGQTVKVALPA